MSHVMTIHNMKIVVIEKCDVTQVQPLWEELNALHLEKSSNFRKHFESLTFEKRIENLLAKEHIIIYVVEVDSNLVGYCIATVNGQVGEIDSLYIKQEYRGNRLGERLINQALSWLNQQGCNEINIYVAEGNESVLSFYENFGFKERFRVLQMRKS